MLSLGMLLQKRYRIDRMHELGAVETIYLGWDTVEDKAVTISETRSQPNLSEQNLAILKQEFTRKTHIMCSLKHAHLIPPTACFIIDIGPHEGNNDDAMEDSRSHSYVITPMIDGTTLLQYVADQGPLPEKTAIAWAQDILDALAYCHRNKILHGDIRPHNIMISTNNQVMLTHFEVPSLWQSSDPRKWTAKRVLGVPDYAPPEKWAMRVGQIDERSDLYSLGATLYYAMTKECPLSAEERVADPYNFQKIHIANPRISSHTKAIIYKAMAVPKDKRYRDAADMTRAFQPAASQKVRDVIPSMPSLFSPRSRISFTWGKLIGIIISGFVIFIAASLGLWLNQFVPSVNRTAAKSSSTPTSTPVLSTTTLTHVQNATFSPTPSPEISRTPLPTGTPDVMEKVSQPGSRTVISDTFTSNMNSWPISDGQDEWGTIVRNITDGVYLWEIGAEQDVGRWCLPDNESYADNFNLSVDVTRQNGPLNIAYGLIVRHNEGRYYVFNARDDGYFRFSLWQGTEWISIIDWTQTLAIQAGETNHLEVRARGTDFEFYINETYVGEATDTEISAGDNGLSAIVMANPDLALIAFDNFMLTTENAP